MTVGSLPSYALLRDPLTAKFYEIDQWIDQGRLQESAQALNSLREVARNDVRLHLLGTKLAETAGNVEQARRSSERALACNPADDVAQIDYVWHHLDREPREVLIDLLNAAYDNLGSEPPLYRQAERAVRAANYLGAHDQARRWLERSAETWPDDPRIHAALGDLAYRRGLAEEAVRHFDRALALFPDHPEALRGRAMSLWSLGQRAAAQADLQRLVLLFEQPPEDLEFLLDATRADVNVDPPLAFIANLFDRLAEDFDTHLVERLGYRAPAWAAELIRARYLEGKAKVLDLGCGTGLLGDHLSGWPGKLWGVDLSLLMIEKARAKGRYVSVEHANLFDWLAQSEPQRFDVVAALDVFIYVGRLEAALAGIRRVLRPNGIVIFTAEAAEPTEPPLVLRPSGRYASTEAYLRELLERTGFSEPVEWSRRLLRREAGLPIDGFFVVAEAGG
ncbi:MAG: methyltransferase domain-containing protein [Casimicrobiaceae bacterium]|nr:methyltransferase domain-containing protein [Casimicrobiaceae bacterium]MCX8097703.1 methyltransferase domain-containing protein [Casimicrobiaceae bacterium]